MVGSASLASPARCWRRTKKVDTGRILSSAAEGSGLAHATKLHYLHWVLFTTRLRLPTETFRWRNGLAACILLAEKDERDHVPISAKRAN
jgi:hypothetical protein